MDIIRFEDNATPTQLENAKVVNGLKTKMWIERYAKAGEFTLTADVDSGVLHILPIGSIISHLDTHELMIVENHEIEEERGKTAEVTISGRGFESFFENRIVGGNYYFPRNLPAEDYTLPADDLVDQIVKLIRDHITIDGSVDDNNALPFVTVFRNAVTPTGIPEIERKLKRGSLYSALMPLLEIADLGIRVSRPGQWSPYVNDINISIDGGVDRSASVIFSHETGEIENIDYLWSNKKFKNTALVTSTWLQRMFFSVDPIPTGFDRRIMMIDATDMDEDLEVAPDEVERAILQYRMSMRAWEQLSAQRDVALNKIQLSKTATENGYRKQFNVGDIVSVRTDYTDNVKMRITEYVEIEDEKGRTGYPSLSVLTPPYISPF